ncbi:Cysteine-rich membrane protein 1 [Spironucleus salmonicida]|uniref:Cysteine-rich membrane protein 1 n=1 Tax=Spironucleus salmonicida TaxID=348837 RepID=V6LZ76_9EUKA|nr:Cysteine-rich membrane protein 1 [Spironucleus salmonicida]|eukprot:EST49583.1 Cysteine-rich membrane protein 1 [Spironucleus salmonicida]
MAESGTCQKRENKCKAGFYCPATDDTSANCLACPGQIVFGQGCSCTDNQQTDNCTQCNGPLCTTCFAGTYLKDNTCKKCMKGCIDCKSQDACQKCVEGYVLNTSTNKCMKTCNSNKECIQEQGAQYCDVAAKICKTCKLQCDACETQDFCYFCSGDEDSVTTINGTCTARCSLLSNGQYCKDGTATACAPGLTSDCKCGNSQNCATCAEDTQKCGSCMPNHQMDKDGSCTICISGFEMRGFKCWPAEAEAEPEVVDKVSTGTGVIVGIIVGVVAVIGAVGGGLAYYFIKKGKK